MKALTLHQPWAKLVQVGAKKFETRSWKTNHRGLLAIHASRNTDAFTTIISDDKTRPGGCIIPSPFDRYFEPFYSSVFGDTNNGGVVCVCLLKNCWPADQVGSWLSKQLARSEPGSDEYKMVEEEIAFGNFSPGRWAWELELKCDTDAMSEVVRGYQGLWNLPKDYEQKLIKSMADAGFDAIKEAA